MEILQKKTKYDVLTVKDIKPGVPFKKVTNEDEDDRMYIKANINTGGYDALCLNNGQLYRDFNAEVVEVTGVFVEDYDDKLQTKNTELCEQIAEAHTIHATNDYNRKQAEYIKSICAELDVVKESKQLCLEQAQTKTDEIIRLNNAIDSLHNDVRDLEEELTETKNLLEHTREMHRQTAEDNDNLRESLTQKDKILDSLRSELKDLRAALNFKSDDEELTVVAAAKAVERITQLERDNEALMFQLQKERDKHLTPEEMVILEEKLAEIGINVSYVSVINNEAAIVKSLVDLLAKTQKSDNQCLTTATKERILKDMTEAGITDFKPVNASTDALVSELTYSYIADHVTCRKILEQCRAFSDAVLKYEEPVLDYSDTDEENDDFDEPTD